MVTEYFYRKSNLLVNIQNCFAGSHHWKLLLLQLILTPFSSICLYCYARHLYITIRPNLLYHYDVSHQIHFRNINAAKPPKQIYSFFIFFCHHFTRETCWNLLHNVYSLLYNKRFFLTVHLFWSHIVTSFDHFYPWYYIFKSYLILVFAHYIHSTLVLFCFFFCLFISS